MGEILQYKDFNDINDVIDIIKSIIRALEHDKREN